MTEEKQIITTIQLESSQKQTLHRSRLIGVGGFSEVFYGELKGEDPRVVVGVKVIKKDLIPLGNLRKKSVIQWRKMKEQFARVRKGSDSSAEALRDLLNSPEFDPKPKRVKPLRMSNKMIRKEIKNMRRLQDNQHVIQLIGLRRTFRQTWIVTEWCIGPVSLIYPDLIDTNDPVDTALLVVHLLAPIMSALLYIHEQGYIHRDVKVGNMLVAPTGVPKLIDFGVCEKVSPRTGTWISILHGSRSSKERTC